MTDVIAPPSFDHFVSLSRSTSLNPCLPVHISSLESHNIEAFQNESQDLTCSRPPAQTKRMGDLLDKLRQVIQVGVTAHTTDCIY